MTLVVAKQKDDVISAVCDTVVTQADGSRPIDKTMLKLVILDDDKAIGFSGSPHYATVAIEEFRKRSFQNRVQVTKFFLNKHIASDGQTDFIMMYGQPSQVLAVKNGRVEKLTASRTYWIGEQAGFKRFQVYWHNGPRPLTVPYWEIPKLVTNDPIEGGERTQVLRMLLALRYVIIERSVPSIAGFMVGITNVSGIFKFVKYALVLDSDFKTVPAQSLLRLEVEEQQDYAQSCIISLAECSKQAVAFHFAKGFLTYLYLDTGTGIFDDVRIIRDKIFAEFEEFTFQEFGLKWNALLVDRRGVSQPGSRGFDSRQKLSGPENMVHVVQK